MKILRKILQFAPQMGGVFSYADLCNLIASPSELKNARTISRLVKEGALIKIQRGFYVTDNPDLWILATRLKRRSYISMDSILANAGLIGTLPEKSVSCVQVDGKKQNITTPFGVLRYFSIKESLAFGISTLSNGVPVADNEKAYLDLLYYYTKGAGFVIDPRSEVNLRKLNREKIELYLKKYRNPKFVSFVQGELYANT